MNERDVAYCQTCGHYTGGKSPETFVCNYFEDTGKL